MRRFKCHSDAQHASGTNRDSMIGTSQANKGKRKSRLYDEKGNRVSLFQLHELLLTSFLRDSQILTDKPYLPGCLLR